MRIKIQMTLALWLTIAATGAWADELNVRQSTESADSIATEVELRDGSVIKARRLPKRAPTNDYVYKYKGVK